MTVRGAIERLQERAQVGRVSLDGSMAQRFAAWLRELSEVERWSFDAELLRPAHRARRTLWLVAGTTDAREALSHRPPAELKSWEARQAKLEHRWEAQTASRYRAFAMSAAVPTDAERQELLRGAVKRLPDGFLSWSRRAASEGLLPKRYGDDEHEAIQRMTAGHLQLAGLQLGGALLPDSWLEQLLIGKPKRRRRSK